MQQHGASAGTSLPDPARRWESGGVPRGIRTPVTAVKGRCPRPLDDGDQVAMSDAVRAYRDGGARRDRTADLYNAIVALSQLSYGPTPGRRLSHVRMGVNPHLTRTRSPGPGCEAAPHGVLGDGAGQHELQQVVGAARLGADAGKLEPAEGLAVDQGAGDLAVDVQVADAELAPDPLDVARGCASRGRRSGRTSCRWRSRGPRRGPCACITARTGPKISSWAMPRLGRHVGEDRAAPTK